MAYPFPAGMPVQHPQGQSLRCRSLLIGGCALAGDLVQESVDLRNERFDICIQRFAVLDLLHLLAQLVGRFEHQIEKRLFMVFIHISPF